MGLLAKFLGREPRDVPVAQSYKTVTEYAPVFTTFHGKIYEQELTHAAIERFATAASKLKPEIQGSAKPAIRRAIETTPNQMMTWSTLLKRTATIFEVDGTAFVVPTFSNDFQRITGFWPVLCDFAEIAEYHGEPWVRFHFSSGDIAAIEYKYVCILTKFQYESDFFGDRNYLDDTMQLIDAQTQAQKAAIKNGAKIRFIGSLTGQVREEEMKKKRERFIEDNLNESNTGGLMLYDQTFSDIRQIEPQSYTISEDEMTRIEENVCTYFGINKDILQNHYDENAWGAWYEGKVEPFAIALGEGLTRIAYTERERQTNKISFSANRLEYASNASKRNMVRDMLDRGVFSINEAREILQLPPVPDGDIRVIRGEYVNAATVSNFVGMSDDRGQIDYFDKDKGDLGGDDVFYHDSDLHGSEDYEY